MLHLVGLLKVSLGLDGVSNHTLVTLLPVGGANLTVLLSELESINESQGLFNRAADGGVVDGDLANNSLGVNEEDTSKGNALLLNKDTVVSGESVVGVGNKGNVNLAKTTLLSGDVGPGKERELRVGRGEKDLGTTLLELGSSLGVGNDLSGADKGESERDESKNNPLALVLLEGDLFKETVNDGLLLESGSRVSDSGDHFYIYVIGIELRERRLREKEREKKEKESELIGKQEDIYIAFFFIFFIYEKKKKKDKRAITVA